MHSGGHYGFITNACFDPDQKVGAIAPPPAGGDRADISTTFLQPFLTYTTPDAWSFTAQSESTYDWKGEQWTVPLNAVVAKVTKIGDQLVSIAGGVRYWADGPESAPHGWGFRLAVTLLFPK